MRKPYSFLLAESLLKELKKEAKKQHRSFNNYVETLLLNHPDRKKP